MIEQGEDFLLFHCFNNSIQTWTKWEVGEEYSPLLCQQKA